MKQILSTEITQGRDNATEAIEEKLKIPPLVKDIDGNRRIEEMEAEARKLNEQIKRKNDNDSFERGREVLPK